MLKGHPDAEELKRDRRAAADAFVRACRNSDVAALYAAADLTNDVLLGGWRAVIRAVAKQVQTVSPDIQQAFLRVWTDSKDLPNSVGDHPALCAAARVLLPAYQGPAVHLFRGTRANEHRRRTYGVCWTADIGVAEDLARARQYDEGSVVLETLAPPEAIICAVEYPESFSQDEIARHKSECPNIQITEFHEEREHVVDRRHLNAVTVVRRYARVGDGSHVDDARA